MTDLNQATNKLKDDGDLTLDRAGKNGEYLFIGEILVIFLLLILGSFLIDNYLCI